MRFFVYLLICVAAHGTRPALAQSDSLGMTVEVLGVYFTPPANSVVAIVHAIDRSQQEVLVQAYGFTHNAIAQALVRAHQRGVTVRVLMDQKTQKSNSFVIDVLQNADIAVRQDGKHAIAHDNRNLT